MNQPDLSDADGTSAPIDLSGVDPTRWDETRRRVAILREWCAKKRHPRSECDEAAAKMGVSVGQFVRLVAVWKTHGDAVRVSGANRRRGAILTSSALPQATLDAIDGTITELGPAAGFTSIRDEVSRRCRDAGTQPPSDSMVHYMLMRARRDVGPGRDVGDGRLLVGHVDLLLPIDNGLGATVIPALMLAVEEDSRIVVAHRLLRSPPPWDDEVASILVEVSGLRPTGSDRVITVAGDLNPPQGTRVTRAGGPRLLAHVLGSHLDTLPLRHQRTRVGEVRRAPGDPVSSSDAELAVAAAITAHNDRLAVARSANLSGTQSFSQPKGAAPG